MEIVKVIMSYSNLTDAKIAEIATIAIAKLTGNVYFVFVNNELTDLVTASDEYLDAKDKAQNGGTIAKLHRREKKKVLERALRRTAMSVNALGYNNIEKLLSSGLPLAETQAQRKARAAREPKIETTPDLKALSYTNKTGEILVTVHSTTFPNKGIVIAYSYEDTPPPAPEDWTVAVSTSLTFTIEGLPPRQILKVCLAFVMAGSKKLNWGDVSTISTV